jgi:hypothetical protein
LEGKDDDEGTSILPVIGFSQISHAAIYQKSGENERSDFNQIA